MHRLRVAAARSAVIANTDAVEAKAAMGSLPLPLPSAGMGSSAGEQDHVAAAAASSLHFVSETVDASMCAAWPTCLSMLGGAPLQKWLKQRIRDEAAPAMPPPGACVDGEQTQGSSVPSDGQTDRPVQHRSPPGPGVVGAALGGPASASASASLLSLAGTAAGSATGGRRGLMSALSVSVPSMPWTVTKSRRRSNKASTFGSSTTERPSVARSADSGTHSDGSGWGRPAMQSL